MTSLNILSVHKNMLDKITKNKSLIELQETKDKLENMIKDNPDFITYINLMSKINEIILQIENYNQDLDYFSKLCYILNNNISLYNKLMINKETKNYIIDKVCVVCKDNNEEVYKKINTNTGYYTCPKCGIMTDVIMENEKNYTKNIGQNNIIYPYKRLNHFSEILNQIQAKENTFIPNSIISLIYDDLKKRRVYNCENLTNQDIIIILKRLNINKYYEHTSYILNKLNHTKPIIISNEAIEKLKNMFKQIQIPFDIYKTDSRKNFLNYYYVLKKFCQMENLVGLYKYCKLPKSKEKIVEQDKIFKKICQYLGWPFIPSI